MLYLVCSKESTLLTNYKKVEFIMKNEKMTVSEKFEQVLGILKVAKASDEIVEFIEERKAMHEKRATKSKGKLSKVQKENVGLVEQINAFFFEQADPEVAYTSKEVSLAIEGMADFTPQKMTALLKKAEVERVDKATNDPKKVGYKAK